MSNMALCVLGGNEHCWERKGTAGYNEPDGTVIEMETERCRHCSAVRERKIVMKITHQTLRDTGWNEAK